MILAQTPATPSSIADWSEVDGLQQKMVETVEAMSALTATVGASKHVVEYDGDRRKAALARAMAAPLAGGSSAAKAESEARASETYAKELSVLAKQHNAALAEIENYYCLKLQWETARSLLSMQKENVKHL